MIQKKTYSLQEATSKLEHYCAYQERCHKEVVSKLQQMGMIPDVIDIVVTHLITQNYLNEERFAKAFTLGKFNAKKWGRLRIVRELKLRDISKYNIDIALKQIIDSDYEKTLHALAAKRLSQITEKHPLKKKKKIADYLLYRGWESHLVYEKVNQLIS